MKLLEIAIDSPGIGILGTYKGFITAKSKKLESRRLLRGKQPKISKCFFALHFPPKTNKEKNPATEMQRAPFSCKNHYSWACLD